MSYVRRTRHPMHYHKSLPEHLLDDMKNYMKSSPGEKAKKNQVIFIIFLGFSFFLFWLNFPMGGAISLLYAALFGCLWLSNSNTAKRPEKYENTLVTCPTCKRHNFDPVTKKQYVYHYIGDDLYCSHGCRKTARQ